MTPARLTSPKVAMRPTTPQCDAGPRIEPPVSEPSATGTSPAATAAPDPVEEPPVKWTGFHGLRGWPRQIERGARVGHLVGGELAQEDRAGLVELGGGGGVLGRDSVDEHP